MIPLTKPIPGAPQAGGPPSNGVLPGAPAPAAPAPDAAQSDGATGVGLVKANGTVDVVKGDLIVEPTHPAYQQILKMYQAHERGKNAAPAPKPGIAKQAPPSSIAGGL